jgi:glycosyltransferase involved in cell wall biosynthesis
LNNGNELRFTGNEYMIICNHIRSISNSFTYEFWVKAEAEHQMDFESHTGATGIHGKKFAFGPEGFSGQDAGMGISIGLNGIAVYEHATNYLPARLVCPWDFSEWQHVAVVYDNKTPNLYINGRYMKQGIPSEREQVYASRIVGGYPYGYFEGSLKDIRIWRGIRSERQIAEGMQKELTGNEPGLFWYENPLKRIRVYEGNKLDIQISVIMPSHNRYPLNLFALNTLNSQTYNASQMEVIFIDDGSTDGTWDHIQAMFQPGFPIKYIRFLASKGRGRVRNIGIRAAAGKVLLFLDTEMLCPPKLLENHMKHHVTGEPMVVSGSMRKKRVYTVYTTEMSRQQLAHMYELYGNNPNVVNMLNEAAYRYAIQLLPVEHMCNLKFLDRYAYRYDYFQEILETYGGKFHGFHYAWINFITSNVSVSKSLIERAGMFDEQFYGYGWEDWELGFRLSKQGAVFIHDEKVVAYHQEHAVSAQNMEQSLKNFYLFQQKHPVMEVRLFVLDMIPNRKNLCQSNLYLDDYKNFRLRWPNQYHLFHMVLLLLLERAAYLLSEGRPIKHLWEKIGITKDSLSYELLLVEVSEIRRGGTYPHLIELFDLLMSMA